MIRKVKFQDIDTQKYNECIAQSVQRSLFAEWDFLKAVNGEAWDCLILDDYQAVMPVPYVYKWGVKIVTKPWAVQQLGIFSLEDSPEINQEFLEFLEKNYMVHYYPFNVGNQFRNKSNSLVNNIIYKDEYEKIRAKYTIDRRRNTRILPKMEHRISFYQDTEIRKYKAFYWKNIQGVSEEKKGDFWKVIERLGDANLLEINVLSVDGELASIAVLLKDAEYFYALLLLNAPEYFKENTPSILIDQILRKNSSDYHFSFMGGNLPQVKEFFRRFSPDKQNFKVVQRSKKELILRILGFR